MKANRPYHEFDGIDTWGNEFSEYLLYPNDFGVVYFQKESTEIEYQAIFSFIVPETEEEFRTVLQILDKP